MDYHEEGAWGVVRALRAANAGCLVDKHGAVLARGARPLAHRPAMHRPTALIMDWRAGRRCTLTTRMHLHCRRHAWYSSVLINAGVHICDHMK
jgi:hypothetical protein